MNISKLLAALLILTTLQTLTAQKKNKKSVKEIELLDEVEVAVKPKLVVGIVVDQMRYDYITRFWDDYGNDGFKKLVNHGFLCKNHHFNYAPTSTGPGHASVYTGASPSSHGIIGNNWYSRADGKSVYCAADENYNSVGTITDAGKMSPNRMLTTTITDQLRLHTQMRGKTIAIALKDRGAVLPGGHTANAAYWFEGSSQGSWITSSYYMADLPQWVKDFNASDAISKYKQIWYPLNTLEEYEESGTDGNAYEGKFKGEATSDFPHNLPALWDENGMYGILRTTPFGNSITTDFALRALEEESLGTDDDTDFLTISYSSADYVGHFYGVNSKEIQDTYLRLDLDIARILNTLNEKVGVGNYTIFLTADHGAIQVPSFLKDQIIPSGYLDFGAMKTRFIDFIKYKYGTTDVLKDISNNQVFLDHKVVNNLDMELDDIQEEIALEILGYPNINKTFTGYQMWNNEYTRGLPYTLQNGWHQKRSGDVLFVQEPGYISYPKTGSTHGSPMIYDTHVPLIFYGKGIKTGTTVTRTEIPDVAPTMAVLLGIAFPNGTTGEPIQEVFE